MYGFNKYVVKIFGGDRGRVGLVLCYEDNSFVGRIDFYPEGATIPKDYLWHPNSTVEYVVVNMPISRFESVMSTVRFDKPLHLYINVSNSGLGAFTHGQANLATTEKEPVGEEEGTP